MHDALAYASYYFGESGTMTAECAMLGTPAIQISGLPRGTIGTLSELDNKYNLVEIYENYDDRILKDIIGRLNDIKFYSKIIKRRQQLIDDTIDMTQYMINLIEGAK